MSPHAFRLAAAAALCLAAAQACKVSVDPNQGRFSCAAEADCGAGYACITQFAGGGLCFPLGACDAVEQCDGTDNNCDGRTDESFPEQGSSCSTGRPGVCAAGLRICADAGLACRQSVDAGAERCNALDDDCDGAVDNGFDLAVDPENCGACGRACPGGMGTVCRSAQCVEVNCRDGLDNDADGGADCSDPGCLAADCTFDGLFNCGTRDADAGTDGGSPDAGSADAGEPDGGAPDAGPPAFCVPKESVCDDGADDDGDGRFDCADADCDGKQCASGQQCAQRVCPGAG